MTAPRLSPLLLASDVVGYVNYKTTDTDVAARLRGAIDRTTDHLTALANRRFDIRIETRLYTARSVEHHGDLMSARHLMLDDDLMTASTITNGDGSVIASGYTLLPVNPRRSGINSKTSIMLDPTGAVYWSSNASNPIGCISIAGTWGYGAEWISAGATLSSGINDSVTSLTSSAALEAGMTIKIDSEFLYVSAVSGTTATVSRAYQGSTAASHSGGVTIYRMRPAYIVQEVALRLLAVSLERAKSPLFQVIQAGDTAIPVDVTAALSDIDEKLSQIKRRSWIGAV